MLFNDVGPFNIKLICNFTTLNFQRDLADDFISHNFDVERRKAPEN